MIRHKVHYGRRVFKIMSEAKISCKDFLKGEIPKISKENLKVSVVGDGDKELFTYTSFENLKDVLNETFTDLSGQYEVRKPIIEKKRIKIEVADKIDGKALSEAQKTLLKVRERFSFFKNMNDAEVLSVTSNVKMLKLKKGEVVFEQGTSGKDVYFIIGGLISITVSVDGVERFEVAKLGGETIFGEMAPITKERRSARATSDKDNTTLLSFCIETEISNANAKASAILFKNFTSILADKLIKTNQMVIESRK